jgi:hypothetical protein
MTRPQRLDGAAESVDRQAEPAELPPGVVHIPEPLAKVVARLALAGIEPTIGNADWPVILRCSRREVDKLRAAGQLPPPDFTLGRRSPRWLARTVHEWMDGLFHGRMGRS